MSTIYFDLAKDVEFYTDNPACSFLGKLAFYDMFFQTIDETFSNAFPINYATIWSGCDPVTYNYDAIIPLTNSRKSNNFFEFFIKAYAPDNSVSINLKVTAVWCVDIPFTANTSHPVFQAANT